MGDMGDYFNDLKQHRKDQRATNGVQCPRCNVVQPKREPSILLPGQRCRVDGYINPRARPKIENGRA